MFKKAFFIITLSSYVAFTGQLLAAIQTQTVNDNIVIHTNTNDFISCLALPLPPLSTDKNSLIQELENLTKDITNNPNMAKAFNILFKSKTLTAKEKIQWIKQKISNLPTPFMLLMALFEEDLDTAKDIFILARTRLNIDVDMCTDLSVQEAIGVLHMVVFSEILGRFGLTEELTDPEKRKLIFYDMEKKFFQKGGFEKFDKVYPVNFTLPYWLAYHGMKPFINPNSDKDTLFKPIELYDKIKKNVFMETKGYASERGNA